MNFVKVPLNDMGVVMTKNLSISLTFVLFCVFMQNSFAQSFGLNQSYFLTDTGSIHTVRSYNTPEGYAHLFSPNGFFLLPEFLEYKKGSYLVDEDETIYTVDADGYVYSYENSLESKITDAGDNFFITRDDNLHIIMNTGLIKTIDSESYEIDSRIKKVGGNYLITRKGTIYIINSIYGSIKKSAFTIKEKDILHSGSNFLISSDGVLMAFGITPTGELRINTYKNYHFKNIKAIGGNYFFDRYNNLHTISASGIIDKGNPRLKNKVRGNQVPVITGRNYFVYADNSVYLVDSNGQEHFLEVFQGRILTETK